MTHAAVSTLSPRRLLRAARAYANTPALSRSEQAAANGRLSKTPQLARNAEVLRLRNEELLSWGEIARRLGVTRNTVAGVVWRASQLGFQDRLAVKARRSAWERAPP